MFHGRNEECGLRCVYHGWKFDIAGNCVDMPSEPPGSEFRHKVTITAYPCLERGGVAWAYMGPAELIPTRKRGQFLTLYRARSCPVIRSGTLRSMSRWIRERRDGETENSAATSRNGRLAARRRRKAAAR